MKKYNSKEIKFIKDVYNKYSHKKDFSKADCVKQLIKHKVIGRKQTFYAWYQPTYFKNTKNHFNPFALSAVTQNRFYWIKDHFEFTSPKDKFSVKYTRTSAQVFLTIRITNPDLKRRISFTILILRILNHHPSKDNFTIIFDNWFKGLVKDIDLTECYQKQFEKLLNAKFIDRLIKQAKSKAKHQLQYMIDSTI